MFLLYLCNVRAHCRKGKEEHQASQTGQPRDVVASLSAGPRILASEITPRAAAGPLLGLGMEPMMATEMSEMPALTSARHLCS